MWGRCCRAVNVPGRLKKFIDNKDLAIKDLNQDLLTLKNDIENNISKEILLPKLEIIINKFSKLKKEKRVNNNESEDENETDFEN